MNLWFQYLEERDIHAIVSPLSEWAKMVVVILVWGERRSSIIAKYSIFWSWDFFWWICWCNGLGWLGLSLCWFVIWGSEMYTHRNPYLSLLLMRYNSASLNWLLKSYFSPRWWLIRDWKWHHSCLLFLQCPSAYIFKMFPFPF